MTVLPAAPAATFEGVKDADHQRPVAEAAPVTPLARGGVSPASVLITEQEVLFSSAAAEPLRPTKTSRPLTDAVRVVAAALARVFATSSERPVRQHYPARNSFLENSRMSREIHRL